LECRLILFFCFPGDSAYRQLLVLSHPGLPLAPLTFPLQKAETVQRLREETRAPEDHGAIHNRFTIQRSFVPDCQRSLRPIG
jgi:hypothetical protein